MRRRLPALVLGVAVAWTVVLGLSPVGGAELPALGEVSEPLPTLPAVTLPPVTLPPLTLPPLTTPPISTPLVDIPSISVAPLVPVPPVAEPPVAAERPATGPAPAGVSQVPTGAAPGATPAPAGVAPSPGGADAPAGAPAHGTADATVDPATAPLVTGPLPLRLRNAASETAQRLSFPLGLAAAILVFLILQPRLDRGDPSVAHAGVSRDDDLLGFS